MIQATFTFLGLFIVALLPQFSTLAQPTPFMDGMSTYHVEPRLTMEGSLPMVVAEPENAYNTSAYLAAEKNKNRDVERAVVGMLIGAGAGVAAGLILYEVVEAQLDFECDESDPSDLYHCEVGRNYSRHGMALVLGAVGAGIGWVIGRRTSEKDSLHRHVDLHRPIPHLKIVPHVSSEPSLAVRLRF